MFPVYEKKEPFKAKYEMYRFANIEEFTSFVEIAFLEKHQIEISLDVYDEDGQLFLTLKTKDKEEIKNLYTLNGREDEDIPVEDIVLEEVFGRPVQTSLSFGETLVYYHI